MNCYAEGKSIATNISWSCIEIDVANVKKLFTIPLFSQGTKIQLERSGEKVFLP
jgi:hypothetical protein